MIQRELARIQGGVVDLVDAPAPRPGIRGFLAPVAAASWFRPWMILAAGWALTAAFLAVQMGLKERIEDQRDEARADLALSERNLASARAVNDRLAQAVREADEQSRLTAANLEAERRRSAALRARQMERAREAQEVLARNSPPSWDDRLRDLAPGPGGDSAADSDSAGLPR